MYCGSYILDEGEKKSLIYYGSGACHVGKILLAKVPQFESFYTVPKSGGLATVLEMCQQQLVLK